MLALAALFCAEAEGEPLFSRKPRVRKRPSPRGTIDLQAIDFKIVHETYRQTDERLNWELHIINADGSLVANITQTPDIDEMYPHASPDGKKLTFVVDSGRGRNRVRSVYCMNIDGTDRLKIADNARQPCWSPDGRYIAYLKGEYERYSTREYATSELFFYDTRTSRHIEHVNEDLHHLYAICWAPQGDWFMGVVHGGMGYSDTILGFEVWGDRVVDLAPWGVKGCRPDLSVDGKTMVWGETDWDLCIGDFSIGARGPQVQNIRKIVQCARSRKVYHVDISPDGKYLTFAYGSVNGGQQVGGMAKGWNICVADMDGNWVQITKNGRHNKEPDWIPIAKTTPQP